MTRKEINEACESFLESRMTPEDFFNKLVDEREERISFEDSRALISLFYELLNIDRRILVFAKDMEESL